MTPPTPPAPFDAPWHAQAFALAVALNEAGHIRWPEWAETFGAALKDTGKNGPLDGSDDYYTAWVTALETLLCLEGIADADLLQTMKSNWTSAFMTTPHGHPVHPLLPKSLQAKRRTR